MYGFLRNGCIHNTMRFDKACRTVANSSLMAAVRIRYGRRWTRILWAKMMLAGFVGALEGAPDPDPVLDEMERMAGRITKNAVSA